MAGRHRCCCIIHALIVREGTFNVQGKSILLVQGGLLAAGTDVVSSPEGPGTRLAQMLLHYPCIDVESINV